MTTPTTEQTQRKSLVRKLAEVMAKVGYVPKTGRNTFHNYNYATEADIVASVRKEMADRGVMLIPSVESMEVTQLQRKNSVERLATMRVRFTFLDGESDEKIELVGMGEGSDVGDKAGYKALTGALKYALLKTFLIPTGDDPEEEAADREREAADAKAKTDADAKARAEAKAKADEAAAKAAAEKKAAAAKADVDKARAARLSRIWESAKARGCKKEDFPAWVKNTLGEEIKSAEWTDAQMKTLEEAFTQ